VAVDCDNDGDVDIWAANRTGPVNILRNNGSGSFSLVTPSTIGITQRGEDGISFVDVNNDGWLDVLLNQHLFLGSAGGQFTFSRTFESTANHYMGGFADLDNDGDFDLVFPGRNYIFLNNGAGTFTQSPAFTLGAVADPRSVAFADAEQDGDLDFFYAQKATYNRLVRNDLSGTNRWIKVQLARLSGQAGAFGSRITVYRAGGLNDAAQRITWWEPTSAHGYLAQGDPVVHLGVGSRYQVDLRVDFPGGVTRTLTGVSTNALIQVQE
jgi:hypothetical protein